MRNTLIFGGTSYIGRALYKRINSQNNNVYVINRPSHVNSDDTVSLNIDITDPLQYKKVFNTISQLTGGEIDLIYLTSWAGTKDCNNEELNRLSASGLLETLRLLLSNNNCRKVIQLGTQAEYGDAYGIVNELCVCNPSSAYGKSKYQFFLDATNLCEQIGVDFTEFRLHSIYGTGCNNLIGRILNSTEDRIILKTACTQPYNFLYVDDLIDALILGQNKLVSNVYNLGDDENYSLKEYLEIVQENAGRVIKYEFGKEEDRNSPGFYFDSQKYRVETGWYSKTSFSDGIRTMIRNL